MRTPALRRWVLLIVVVAGGVLAAPVIPADAGGGCDAPPTAPGSGVVVDLVSNCMSPRVLHVPSGAEVTFHNRDQTMHNLSGDGWGIDQLPAGKSFARRFDEGTHVYACTLHPGMVGAVVAAEAVSQPVASLASSTRTTTSSRADRLPLGLALGLVAAVGVRRLRLNA